jgi:tetratricopeptide (TPR) repeat protein
MPRPQFLVLLALAATACLEVEVTAPKDPALMQRVQELEAKRRASPNDLAITIELAMTMQASGDLFGAAEILKSAAEQSPSAPEPLLGLHRVYTELGYTLNAYKALETCIEKNPRQPECLFRMASFLLLQDGSEVGMRRSRELFTRFLEVAPEHPQSPIVRDALKRMEESLGPPDEGAVPSSQPSTSPPSDRIGAHEGAAGQEVGALNPFGKAISDAMRAADNQDAPGAEAAFRRALGFQPGDGMALAGLAEALFSQGKVPEAVSTIEKAYADNPTEPIVQFVFGLVMVKSKQGEARGLEAWKKLVSTQPEYAEKLGVPRMLEAATKPGTP